VTSSLRVCVFCPVYTEAFRGDDPLSRMFYQMSKDLIVSEFIPKRNRPVDLIHESRIRRQLSKGYKGHLK